MKYTIAYSLLLVLTGCAAPNTPDSKPSTPTQTSTINFTDADHGVHLEYPADWADEGVPATGQVLLTLELPTRSNGFPPTLQLSTQTTGGPLHLGEIEGAVTERAQNSLAAFRLVSNGSRTLGNEPARQIIFQGTNNGIPVETMTVVAVHSGQGYAISFAADPKVFDQSLASVQKVLDSIVFTK